MFAMLPFTLLILEAPYFVGALTWIATFSMLPLLSKDKLLYYYWILQTLFYFIVACIQPISTMYRKDVKPPIHPLLLQLNLSSSGNSTSTSTSSSSSKRRNNTSNRPDLRNIRTTQERYLDRKSPIARVKTPFNTPQQSNADLSEFMRNGKINRESILSSSSPSIDESASEMSIDSLDSIESDSKYENFDNLNENDVTFLESRDWKQYVDSKNGNNNNNNNNNIVKDKNTNTNTNKNRNKNKEKGYNKNDDETKAEHKSKMQEEWRKSAFLAMAARNQQNEGCSINSGDNNILGRCYGSSADEGYTYGEFPHAAPLEKYSLYWSYAPLIALFVHMASNVEFSDRYPDIGVYMIVIFCCANFCVAWLLITAHN